MPSIHVLPDSLVNKIAAGEVIERPASVVKELVENSLDAGANRIDIEISEGGRKGIIVCDNGCGIPPDEMALALSPHATSKISNIDDLQILKTLGFRGEALSSIAAVSKMTLTSRQKGGAPAREIQIEGGKIVSEGVAGHPEGSRVSVRFLFFHTPARLKFLKSPETEMAHITDYVTRAAFSHPHVSIQLSHNGKSILRAPLRLPSPSRGEGGGEGDHEPVVSGAQILQERLRAIFGREVADQCYEFSASRGGSYKPQSGAEGEAPIRLCRLEGATRAPLIEIWGLIGHPQISRSGNQAMYFFVNGRPVRDKVIHHAVLEGYRNLLMRGRYPFIVLFLHLPAEMVDVNVHPAKAEVRFSNSSVVHDSVYTAVREKLEEEPWKNERFGAPAEPVSSVTLPLTPSLDGRGEYVSSLSLGGRGSGRGGETAPVTGSNPVGSILQFAPGFYSRLQVIGQIMNTYILCETEGKMVMVDQHAAHERIGFEKLIQSHRQGSLLTQPLLIPENFDLNPSDTEILKKYLEELASVGIEIEFFGGNTFVVKSWPVFFPKMRIKDFVLDLVGDALDKGQLSSLRDNLNAVFASMACHSAIRANHPLQAGEMRALLYEMDLYPFTSTCPHGRPIYFEVSRYELEKKFRRV